MARNVKFLIIDVDGTMTDSGIYYDDKGNELKKFSTRDAAGFFAAHAVGIPIMVLTGRISASTERRMKELGVDYLCQNINNKESYLKEFIKKRGIPKEELGYIGDDLNDLPSMKLCSFVGCPSDSCKEVLEIASYVSPIKGGDGVVRDIVEHILRESGEWNRAISNVYMLGV